MSDQLICMTRLIQNNFAGHVSKTVLLNALLPFSFASLFGSLIAAARFFPAGYDWRVLVISKLTSPHDNPQGCWLPAVGIMVALLLAFPFAGYVAQRLHGIAPRLGRSAGLAFAFGFVLMFLSVAVQLAQPVIGLRWLHEFLARAAAGTFVAGMLCCCACALKDRVRCFGGQGLLPANLALCWLSLTLLPIGCAVGIGSLMLLGHPAGLAWAEDFRQSFRHTVFWQLAFWEWIGAGVAFGFLAGSVLLLPDSCEDTRKRSARALAPAAGGVDSFCVDDGGHHES